ncbi:hypothetical protein [Pseudomonas sp. RIT-PI-S]|uniref:hypothetical protein n=1 Tax=Pseudomonas sp. RIT-PI-S TaxID=3035295 RepID=UPI0021D81AD2|nr:hypothetical protein [Pseudomonas sp. RIT-PI-S]
MFGYRIMNVIGSAVPERLRDLGLLACWYVVLDGHVISPPLMSRKDAEQYRSDLRKGIAA